MSGLNNRYKVGSVLSLRDSQGREVTQAGVLEYDPKGDTPNWHVVVQDPNTEYVLPAAIWDHGAEDGTFGLHFTNEQLWAEFVGEVTLYSSEFLEDHVGHIVAQVVTIVPIKLN